MKQEQNSQITLENFDTIWALGEPTIIEKEFNKLLPEAKSLTNKSIYLQILSQIALAQALQKEFESAHKTLDSAEAQLTQDYPLAQVRIVLEKGRVLQQESKITEAKKYFEQSYELSSQHNYDYHTINAAHMIAIVAQEPQEKITWNQRAIDLALHTKDKRAQDWLGSLYNNLGQNYMETNQFEKALEAFKKALEYRIKEDYTPNIRVAKWAIGRALRSLNRLDEALDIQQALVKKYDIVAKSNNINMPLEMFKLTRGWVYEEIAEIYAAKAHTFATLALEDLSENEMFRTTEPKRLERLKEIQNKTY